MICAKNTSKFVAARTFKVDAYGGFVKAFDCANICALTCQAHFDAYGLNLIGWTVGDSANRTLYLDNSDIFDEKWWDPSCPELVCRVGALEAKYFKKREHIPTEFGDAVCAI